MNKFSKLLLSGTLLAVPSYGTTSTTIINADIDYTNGGTLNINVDTTLNANHTITLGEAAIGTIARYKTLTNNGTIKYNVTGSDPNSVTGVFRAGDCVINQDYNIGNSKVKGAIIIENINYNVTKGCLLNDYTGDYEFKVEGITEQKVLYDGYMAGKMTPDLAVLSAPIQYIKENTIYTFGMNSQTNTKFNYAG